jgi:hypothetical protein
MFTDFILTIIVYLEAIKGLQIVLTILAVGLKGRQHWAWVEENALKLFGMIITHDWLKNNGVLHSLIQLCSNFFPIATPEIQATGHCITKRMILI